MNEVHLPATINPTVELWVYHLTSFIAIGLFSGESDLISPIKHVCNYSNITRDGKFTYRTPNRNLQSQFVYNYYRNSSPAEPMVEIP